MEPPIPLKSVVLFIACGTMVFVIVFIFAKRQITRFTLKSSRAPHATIGADAPKALRQEIERRLKRVADIQHEPQLLSHHVEDTVRDTFNGEPCHFIYRMKAVDAIAELDAALKAYSPNIQRVQKVQALRPFLLELRQSGPLHGLKLDVIEKFADSYDHARHDPLEFKKEQFQEYIALLHQLTEHIYNKKNLSGPGSAGKHDKPGLGTTPRESANIEEQQAIQQQNLLNRLSSPANQSPDTGPQAANQVEAELNKEGINKEVTYRPRKRKDGNVQAPLSLEAVSSRDSGGSSSLASEGPSVDSFTSSPCDSTESSGGTLIVKEVKGHTASESMV